VTTVAKERRDFGDQTWRGVRDLDRIWQPPLLGCDQERREMKQRHAAGARAHARLVLEMAGIALGQDFATLRSAQVDELLVEADRVRYQKPRHANGSRGRYFHDLLQRQAKAEPKA
jgi:hypothetical protein